MDEAIIQIAKGFPKGFYEKQDKEGKIIECKTRLDTGDLTGLLEQHLQKRLRYNLLKLQVEIDKHPIDPDLLKNFYIFLSRMGWSCPYKFATDSLLWAAHKNNYHPIVEFLENIEKNEQIIPADIDQISTKYLGTNDDLSNKMMKVALVGMIARVMNRGCKFDTCLVLKGKQGIGKSSFWRILAGNDWFCDTWQDNLKDLFFNIQTSWVFELAELDGMTNKKDAAQIKSLLSSSKRCMMRAAIRSSTLPVGSSA